jgi:hypothetical protein
MAEHSPFILPVASRVETNCYPLQRKESYVFDDGSRLERDIPYWQPAEELFIDDEGVHYADEDQQGRLRFLSSLVSMSDG